MNDLIHSTSRFPKGLAMRFMSRTTTRACPLALILATLPVMAQEIGQMPVPALAPVTMPATQPATTQVAEATTMPATTQAAEATTMPAAPAVVPTRPYDPNARVSFNFKEASIDSVLDYLSEYLGFIIIKDGPVSGRITMTSRQPIGASDAADLLNSALKPVNYTAIQTGRALRVVSRDKAKRANIPVHIGADPSQIKNSDELITQIIPLSQVDAVKVRADLQALYSADADVTSNAASNTIIITDSSANIRRIVEIIAAMDHQMAATADIKVFQLQYASATNAAKLINDLFKTDQGTQQQGGGGRGGFAGFAGFGGRGGGPGGGGFLGAGGNAAATDTGGRTAGKVTASADDRTNTLVVTGPTATLAVITDVVKQLDANPAENSTVFVYHIRNGQAQNMQSVLNTLFGTSTTGSSGQSTTSTQTRTPFGSSSFGSSSSGSSGSSFGSTSGSRNSSTGGRTGGSNTGSTNNRGGFGGGTASLSSTARAAAGDLAGQVYVVADLDTNSIIVTTAPKYVDRVKEILAQLDRSVPQVLIKVLFAEVTHTNDSDLGFEMSYVNGKASNPLGNAATDFGLANATNGLNYAYVTGDFTARLHALANDGKVDVLSRPYILASDNQLASILVGQEVPIITDSRTTDTGQTINTVAYKDVGIILNVTPHINPDGKVIMDVAPQISALVENTSVQISAGITAPLISMRSAQSRVAIDNGQTIVIGGLMEDKKDVSVSKVPLLGDIPWIGNLFRRTKNSKSKTELLIFLTPHVAMESSTLKGMSQDELNGVKILPHALTPETVKEHIQGMQRGATTAPSEPLNVPVVEPEKPEYKFK